MSLCGPPSGPFLDSVSVFDPVEVSPDLSFSYFFFFYSTSLDGPFLLQSYRQSLFPITDLGFSFLPAPGVGPLILHTVQVIAPRFWLFMQFFLPWQVRFSRALFPTSPPTGALFFFLRLLAAAPYSTSHCPQDNLRHAWIDELDPLYFPRHMRFGISLLPPFGFAVMLGLFPYSWLFFFAVF